MDIHNFRIQDPYICRPAKFRIPKFTTALIHRNEFAALKSTVSLIHRSFELHLRLNLQILKFAHACIPCGRRAFDIPGTLDTLFRKASYIDHV